MQRSQLPRSAVRLHRFSSPKPPLPRRLLRRLSRLPLFLPLCGGMCLAGLINALAPATAAAEPSPPIVQDPIQVQVAATNPERAPSPPPPPPVSTRVPHLEDALHKMLVNGKTPYSAVVVMEAATGKVLALAEHSTRDDAEGLAMQPMSKAASVFKVITASALLEQGVKENERVCFHGGKTRMQPKNLLDSKRDQRCTVFGDVVAYSHNVAVAKLASKHLSPQTLRAHAARWGFDADIAVIPDDEFGFAEAAAGFGDVKLSAMHGAIIASVVANDGLLIAPTLVDADVQSRRVIDEQHARVLRKMMKGTVEQGTARRVFAQKPALPFTAAGKTGSLADYSAGLDHSWFVGFAPAEAPEIVVAAVVVNTGVWHIKAPWLAKESMRLAMKERGATTKNERVARR